MWNAIQRIDRSNWWRCIMQVLVLTLLMCLVKLCQGQEETNNIDSFLENADASIKVLWGVPDTVTSVGKVFRYKIPEDAFQGKVLNIEVSVSLVII